MEKLAERLRDLRNSRGLSQQKAAEAYKIGFMTLRRYENDEREPNASVLWRIADFYDVSVDYLIGRTDTP